MADNGTVEAKIVHKDQAYAVKLRCIPREKELLRVFRAGSDEPLCFEVRHVVHHVEVDADNQAVEIHVKKSGKSVVTDKAPRPWIV